MMNLRDKQRLRAEQENLRRRLPAFRFCREQDGLCVKGFHTPGLRGTTYLLSATVPPLYPHEPPDLYVLYPQTLMKRYGRGTVNEVGTSHEFHTLGVGLNGCVRICHCNSASWHASRTLMAVLIKGVYWCLFYEEYLNTGKSIAFFFDRWKEKISKQRRILT